MTPRTYSSLSFGHSYSRPRRLYPLTCQLCDMAFPTDQAIIEHYQSHVDEIIPARQEGPLPQGTAPNHINLNPNQAMTQSQSQSFFENNPNQRTPQNGQVTNPTIGSSSSASQQLPPFSFPTTITNQANRSRANNSPFLSTYLRSKRRVQLLNPNHAKIFKGFDGSSRNTRWLLGRLERCIPNIINLEEENRYEGLDLELKL